jgi:hypothetical protein
VREFLEVKRQAERRLAALELPWTILRFGRLTEDGGTGRIRTTPGPNARLAVSRDDAALTIVEALLLDNLVRRVVHVVEGDRAVREALDAIEPVPLPLPEQPPTGATASLGFMQSDNPPDASDMIEPDAPPLDADVDWEGDGPVAPEPVGNEDPAPRIP